MPSILVNALPLLTAETGVGRYTRQIAQAVSDSSRFDVTFFYGRYAKSLPRVMEASHSVTRIKSRLARYTQLFRACKKVFALYRRLANTLHAGRYDCYFEPNFILQPGIHSRHAVLTAHDFSCFRYPQWHPLERVRYMERYFSRSLEQADVIITVSAAICQEALSLFHLAPERVRTIHNGLDHGTFHPVSDVERMRLRRHYGLPEHFILHVGTLEPRKNLRNLQQAHAALPVALQRRYPLLLVGADGWNNSGLHTLIDTSPHVRWLGYLPEAGLAACYNLADVFAYPSWYEGFGLPVVEAMACGCPVLASTDPALSEVCNGAAKLVPPEDVPAMSAALREMLEDEGLRQTLREKGMAQAACFSWAESARQHLELFLHVSQ